VSTPSIHVVGVPAPDWLVLKGALPAACGDGEQGCGAQAEEFFFQGADIPAVYDLVNWQTTTEGSLKLVVIGRVDGLELHFNKSTIQWTTGSSQVAKVKTFRCNIITH